MSASVIRASILDHDRLVRLVTGNDWPFHVQPVLTATAASVAVRGWLEDAATEVWWLYQGDIECGIVRIFDLDDGGAPLFDLRIAQSLRGRGMGTAAVNWIATHVFSNFDHIDRIEATTRVDNAAMRRALEKAGWAKESHWRMSWPVPDGRMVDGVGYGVLRRDWMSGETSPVAWQD